MPNYVIKKIIHYPKEPVMEIGAKDAKQEQKSQFSSLKSDMALSDENKAKELVLSGGSKITKEMLENMEFSSSSEESSSESSAETKSEKRVPIKNIDLVVLENAQGNKNLSSSSDSSDNDSEILTDDENEQIDDAFYAKFNEKNVLTDQREALVDKLDNLKIKNSSEEVPQETTDEKKPTEQKIENLSEELVKPEEKAPEKEEEPQKKDLKEIPIGSTQKQQPSVYQFTPQSINSLPAKLFVERIKTEFHCSFVTRKDDSIVLNDLFKKSYTKRLLSIIDEELNQPDLSAKFIASLEELRHNVANKTITRKDYDVSYTIDKILSIKERTPITLNIDKKIFALQFRREKREDVVSLFRFELNRIAWTNSAAVIERIKKFKIYKDSEMSQLSRILFEKAISEDAFCKLYAHVVQNLYKTFKSEEEKKRHEVQTKFFSEIINFIQEVFNKKEKWASQLDLSSYSPEERLSMQDVIEDENIIKEKKKGRMLGTVKFVSFLYANGVIGFKGVSFCLNSLCDFNDEENVETLSLLITNCGEKIVESDKSAELTKIVNELRKPWNWSLRIKFLTQDVIAKCDEWFKTKKKKSPFKNAFSALQQTLNTPESANESDAAKNEPQIFKPSQKTPEVPAVVNENQDEDDQIYDVIDKISRIVEDIPQVIDYVPLVDEMKEKAKDIAADLLFKAYFLIIMEHYNQFNDDLKFLKFFLDSHTDKPSQMSIVLDDIQKKIPDIEVDCPFAKKNFNILVYCLNTWLNMTYSYDGYEKDSGAETLKKLDL